MFFIPIIIAGAAALAALFVDNEPQEVNVTVEVEVKETDKEGNITTEYKEGIMVLKEGDNVRLEIEEMEGEEDKEISITKENEEEEEQEIDNPLVLDTETKEIETEEAEK